MDEIHVLRKWQFQFNRIAIRKLEWISIIYHFLTAPEYSLRDYLSLIRGTLLLLKSKEMFADLINISLEYKTNFSTAVFILGGRNDPITHSQPVYEYFEKIKATYKKFIWFEQAGHNHFFEEKNKFIECLYEIHQLLKC